MPALTYVMALEGVLAGKDDDVELTQEGVDPTGMALYAPFARTGRLILATAFDRRLVDHWLRLSGLQAHSSVVKLDDRVIRRLRATGESIDLFVDANADRAAQAVREGVPTMLFTRPLYARASHRPDLVQPTRQWATVVAEQAAQRAARARPLLDLDS